jgi:hypothetical protein
MWGVISSTQEKEETRLNVIIETTFSYNKLHKTSVVHKGEVPLSIINVGRPLLEMPLHYALGTHARQNGCGFNQSRNMYC